MRNRKHVWILCALVLLYALLGAGCSRSAQPKWEREGWNLVWHDEFDGPADRLTDSAIWTPEIGDGSDRRIPG